MLVIFSNIALNCEGSTFQHFINKSPPFLTCRLSVKVPFGDIASTFDKPLLLVLECVQLFAESDGMENCNALSRIADV